MERKSKLVDLNEEDKDLIIKYNKYDIKLYDFYKNYLEIKLTTSQLFGQKFYY